MGLENKATQIGLDTANTTSFRSVLVFNDQLQLAEVKAVSDRYPLRGRLRTSLELFGEPKETDTIPAPGEAWADARLMSLLGVSVGDTVELGAISVRLTQVLGFEPDRGGDIFSIAPRILINHTDVARTELVQPGSRVQLHAATGRRKTKF